MSLSADGNVQSAKTAVVTGVSTGIGRAISKQLIAAGWHVFGSVRKQSDADAAREALGEHFTPLIFDVTQNEAVLAAAEQVQTALAGQPLNGLVNNAGVSTAAPMRYVSIEEIQALFDVNVYGMVRTIQAFLPLLEGDVNLAAAPGKIINMSSVSGRISVPFMGPYSMSKYAVEALSDALRGELLPHGIDVVIIEPGPVKTPIFEKTENLDFSPYAETEYHTALQRVQKATQSMGARGLEPDTIGTLVLDILTTAKPKTRYPILKNKFTRWTLPKLIPTRRLDRLMAKRMGLKPRP